VSLQQRRFVATRCAEYEIYEQFEVLPCEQSDQFDGLADQSGAGFDGSLDLGQHLVIQCREQIVLCGDVTDGLAVRSGWG
jgi:hypothetical protein